MANDDKFSILFSGDLQAGVKRDAALKNIAQLTNLDPEELLDELFSVKPVIINQVNSRELADSYRSSFTKAGLQVTVEPYEDTHDEIMNVALSFSHYAPLERQQIDPNFQVDAEAQSVPKSQKKDNGAKAPAQNRTPYRVIFDGQLESGMSKQAAIENIALLTNCSQEMVTEQIFSVVPVTLIETDDLKLAQTYQRNFAKAGLCAELSQIDEFSEILATSCLRVRQDAPPPPSTKATPPFVYLAGGLLVLVFILWSGVFLFYKGYFDQPNTPVLAVRLAPAIPAPAEPPVESIPKQSDQRSKPVIEEIKIPPVKKKQPKAIPKPKAPTQAVVMPDKQTSLVKEVLTPTPTPTPPPPSPPPAKPSQPLQSVQKVAVKPASKQADVRPAISAEQKKQLEQDYFMELLNWFALPEHQQYDSQTKKLNLEGEIKVTISIYRDGSIKNVAVLESSSEQLSEITRQSAYNASPYPPVPKHISGDSYAFTLPLKYTLEN